MRENHNLWMVDGGEDSDRGGAGGIDVMPSVDAIAEFRALTSNYSADFGLSSAGTMTIVFKSGTKQFHAGAWEFLRNDALDAGNYFNNAARVPSPELRFNTYGFNAGGPLTLGKFYNTKPRQDFFLLQHGMAQGCHGGNLNQTVPSASEYGGQFPASVPIHVPNANQLSPTLLSKFTSLGLTPGQAFPNNTIPSSLLDANAQALLKAGIFPGPNNGGTQFVGGAKQPTNVREELTRIDHQFSDKFWIFGHWVSEQISQTYGTSLWSGDNVPTVGTVFGNPAYSAVMHATYSISPTLLNETSFNYNGNRINIVPVGNFARPSGVTIPELFAGNNLNRIPSINLQAPMARIMILPVGLGITRLTITRFATIFPGQRARISSRSAPVGRCTRRFRICSGTRKVLLALTAITLVTISPISCSVMRTPTPNWRCRTRASGTTFRMQPIFRTTGVSIPA